jgi:glycosyltransferase involved in cell wall biosynthesis
VRDRTARPGRLSRASARPVRVLHLVAGCQVGGLEVVTLSLVARLRDEFDFRVVCYDAEGPLKDRFRALGVDVALVPRREGVDLGYPFRLARLLRREAIDVVHAHNDTALFYGVLAAVVGGGRRVVYTAHDRSVPKLPLKVLQRLLGRATTCAVAVSEAGRERLLALDGFDPHRVVVVHNGADECAFASPPERDAARRLIDLEGDAEVVGTVARLHREKNVTLLVRAFARLASVRKRARLVVAGDGPERAACEDTARRLGVAERCRFLGTRDDVATVLAALDVFALSSDTEGLPVAVLEAMAVARPVVATDVGAVREVVQPDETGLLVRAGDEIELAGALAALLSDPRRAHEMGRRGAEEFRGRFTLARMASEYRRLYRSTAGADR